jgi:glycosyltransferase involved in cell wall biosynthesis
VRNGETGIVIEGYSKQEVAEGLRRLLSLSPAARGEMGRRAREFALSRHSLEVVARRYRELLAGMVKV